MSDEAEKAWAEYAVGGEHGPGPVTYRGAFMAGRASVRDNFSSLRSRIGALEAVIASVGELADKAEHGALRWADPLPVPEWVERVRAIITLAPSVVLDQMIREAKAEALTEAAARARALFDMRTTLGKPSDEWLQDRAAEYRNGVA